MHAAANGDILNPVVEPQQGVVHFRGVVVAVVIEFHVAIVLGKGAVHHPCACGHQGIAAVGVEHRVVDERLAAALADADGRQGIG